MPNALLLDTLRLLPEHGSRFGTMSLGYDRVTQIRDEYSAMLDLAADLCAVPAVSLSLEDLRVRQQRKAACSALNREDLIQAATASFHRLFTALNTGDPMRDKFARDLAEQVLALGAK